MSITLFAIAAGGAVGAVSRYLTSQWAYSVMGKSFPFGTLLVNFTGSFAAGLLTVLLIERLTVVPELRAAILIGFLGSFTTFSAFSYETLSLVSGGDYIKAVSNVLISLFVCLTACWFGILLGRQL